MIFKYQIFRQGEMLSLEYFSDLTNMSKRYSAINFYSRWCINDCSVIFTENVFSFSRDTSSGDGCKLVCLSLPINGSSCFPVSKNTIKHYLDLHKTIHLVFGSIDVSYLDDPFQEFIFNIEE